MFDIFHINANIILRFVLFLFAMSFMLFSFDANAANCSIYEAGTDFAGNALTYPPGTYDGSSNKSGQTIFDGDNVPIAGFTGKIVRCIENIIRNAPSDEIKILRDNMAKVSSACLILYLIYFLLKVVFNGVQNIRGEVSVVILTLSITSYFMYSVGVEDYLEIFTRTSAALVDTVTRPLMTVLDANAAGGPPGARTFKLQCTGSELVDVWQRIDCLIFRMLGFGAPLAATAAAGSAGQVVGLVALAPVFILAGPPMFFVLLVGMLITPIFLFVIFFLLSIPFLIIAAFGQAILVYITSFIAVTFLGILAPIMIPLYLFDHTKQIFNHWLIMIIGYTLQPAMIMAYLVFMVFAIDMAFSLGDTDIDGPSPSIDTIYKYVNELEGIDENGDPADPSKKTEIRELTCLMCIGSPTEAITSPSDPKVNCQYQSEGISGAALEIIAGGAVTSLCVPNINLGPDETDITSPDNNTVRIGLSLVQHLFIIMLTLAMTFKFMNNVLAFGSQIAGLTASSVSDAVNIYNRVAGKIERGLS